MLEELKLSFEDGEFYYSKHFDELGYREIPSHIFGCSGFRKS